MNQDPTLDSFCAFFNKLDKTCTEKLGEIYTDEVVFIDPLHRIEGKGGARSLFRDPVRERDIVRIQLPREAAPGPREGDP
ncbi:nuclear transport factor 2 family protein [Halomonas sp.]|jgi:hypothetical protein|uniref:nuclear transport factor 2 family protein n=1 Tax=Halomonas sp. TaxID=1486246 RepID=UPI003568587A